MVVLGGTVTLGWLLQIPELVRIVPGFAAMAFNTALCFVLMGAALTLADVAPAWRTRAQVLLGGLTVAIAALVLSQDLFTIDIGIDHLFSAEWLQDERQFHTRMAPNTVLAFILSGATLILLNLGRGRWAGYAVKYLALVVGLIGLTGLLGYVLRLEFLFAWYPYARMAVHTASGVMLLGIGLWACWHCTKNKTEQTDAPDARIVFTGSVILIVMALTAGIGGFLVLVQQTETILKRGLQVSLHNRVEVYRDTLNNAVVDVRDIASRLAVQRALRKLRTTPNDPEASDFLRQTIASYIGLGMSAVALDDADGRRLTQAGAFARAPALRVPLNLPYQPELLWDKGMVLHTRVPIIVDKKFLGTITAEQPLPLLTKMFENVRGLGETGEMVLCTTQRDEIACFPTRLRPETFTVPRRVKGKLLAIAQALDGLDNVSQATDYHGNQVIAAYSPVYQTGLGLVIKMNVEEVYLPLNRQFQQILLLLLALVVGGILLLRWQVLPLARQLVQSREEIRALSLTDELTGLRNRRGLMTLAEAEFLLAQRMKRGLALFYIDLDDMKTINDTHGHAEGDNALRDLADILRKVFRDSDILARLGGDEFAVLALETAQHGPGQVIQRLETYVSEHNRDAGRRYALSFSVGAVHIEPGTAASLDELLKQADAEMYRVKQKRRATRGR